MKNKVLPFSLLVLISALLFSFTYISDEKSESGGNDQSTEDAVEYFAKLRNNQHTGTIDAMDLMRANQQVAQGKGAYKSASDMEWQKMGPDNFSGRTRALLWDNQDPDVKTIYAGCVTGGIWKSTTTGLTWKKINGDENNLMVTSMVQDENGRIYVGTGESFTAQDYSQFGQYGYTGGLQGSGVYFSDDGETFQPVADSAQLTDPDWFYVNKLAYDPGSKRLFAATTGGLKVSTDGGNTWNVPEYAVDSVFYYISASYNIQCDSIEVVGSNITMYNPDTLGMTIDTTIMESMRHTFEIEGNAIDVTVASDGSVAAMVDGGTYSYVFVYQDGDDFVFENKSNNPNNPFLYVKDSLYQSFSLSVTYGNDTSYQEIDDSPYKKYKGTDNDISLYAGRIELAFAPSDPNHMYASACYESGSQIAIYYSDDKGDNWHIILPGVSYIEILGDEGMYSSTIAVLPDNPGKILVGGQNMWEGLKVSENGFFNWLQKSNNSFSPYSLIYLPNGHHTYAFRPGHNNEVLVGTDDGIYIGLITPTLYEFEPLMKGYMTTQFYTVGPSGSKEKVLGGAQENGTISITGHGNTQYAGSQVWINANGLPHGGTGGYCNISLINPEVYIYSKVDGTPSFRRTNDAGESYSTTNFTDGPSFTAEDFLIPTALWESFNDSFSQDSAKFIAHTQSYSAGEIIQIRSNTWDYPFNYQLEEDLPQGDSIFVKDIIQSKYFLATPDNVWMTNSIHDFTQDVIWWNLANTSKTEFEGNPTSMAYSQNANHLFVGTMDGDLFRISNMANAFSEETADCNSDKCIISTKHLPVVDPDTGDEITQVITSVSVDQENANHVVITLGNYGNNYHVYETRNALDSIADWRPIQGDPENGGLPQVPVYSSLIEMSNSELVIVGTEKGIYTSTNTMDENPTWTYESQGIGRAPIMMLRQQTVKKLPEYVEIIIGNDTSYVEFPGTNNYGVIYSSTYGRGLYMNDQYQKPVGIDEVDDEMELAGSIDIYPNPVNNQASLAFELPERSNVTLNIYNLNGRLVDALNLNGMNAGKHEIKLDVGKLPRGSYIIQMLANDRIFANGKFIVIN